MGSEKWEVLGDFNKVLLALEREKYENYSNEGPVAIC